jgi:hypothetical protein
MPGVSTKIACAASVVRMPRIRRRVVCGFGETIATLSPTKAFVIVLLPTFGRPTMATKPLRNTPSAGSSARPKIASSTAASSAGAIEGYSSARSDDGPSSGSSASGKGPMSSAGGESVTKANLGIRRHVGAA